MSLAVTFHNGEFGIVCSDSRVSMLLADGRHAAMPGETARKFIILREAPGLVLVGTSSISRWLDFSVYGALRNYVEYFPEASFDQVAGIVGPTVDEARAEFGVLSGARSATAASSRAKERPNSGKMYRFLAGKFFGAPSASPKVFTSADGNFLNLLGYDRERMRVRNRVFSCTDRCEQSEQQSGVTISGFLDPEEAWVFAGKFLDRLARETPKCVIEAMLSLAAEISASHPETIGPPYCFHLVTKAMSRGGGIIEEEFRRALATGENRAMQFGLDGSRESQLRTA